MDQEIVYNVISNVNHVKVRVLIVYYVLMMLIDNKQVLVNVKQDMLKIPYIKNV